MSQVGPWAAVRHSTMKCSKFNLHREIARQRPIPYLTTGLSLTNSCIAAHILHDVCSQPAHQAHTHTLTHTHTYTHTHKHTLTHTHKHTLTNTLTHTHTHTQTHTHTYSQTHTHKHSHTHTHTHTHTYIHTHTHTHTHTHSHTHQYQKRHQKPDLMMGKYPLVSVASTCRDSSRTGSGSRAAPPPSSPLAPPPGQGWGRMFFMHSLISQDVSCTCA